jgi:hypothetical protein
MGGQCRAVDDAKQGADGELAGSMLRVYSGTVLTLRTWAFTDPAYNLIRVGPNRVAIELRIPGGRGRSLGEYPRAWPAEMSSRHIEPLVPAEGGPALAND